MALDGLDSVHDAPPDEPYAVPRFELDADIELVDSVSVSDDDLAHGHSVQRSRRDRSDGG